MRCLMIRVETQPDILAVASIFRTLADREPAEFHQIHFSMDPVVICTESEWMFHELRDLATAAGLESREVSVQEAATIALFEAVLVAEINAEVLLARLLEQYRKYATAPWN